MALRTIRIDGDELLRKKSREVKEFNDRIKILVQDMIETMYHANGVGLAAPQIGILRRIAVIDVGDGPIVLINPKIISKEGSQIDEEGCLSVPGIQGMVERPMKVKVEAFNENGEKFILEGEELLARAICHELDHLDGVLFTDKTIEI
jgi:peptide deformylase